MTSNAYVPVIVLTNSRVSEFAPPSIQHILSYAAGWLAALGMEYVYSLKRTQELTFPSPNRLASFYCNYIFWGWLYYSSLCDNDHGL